MLQLLEKVRQRFYKNRPRPLSPQPAVPTADWASIIWAYTQSLWSGGWSHKNSDRAERECSNFHRGLAYGQVRITEANAGVLKLSPLGEQKITTAQVRPALETALAEQGLLERVKLEPGTFGEGFCVNIVDDRDPLSAHRVCSVNMQTGEQLTWRQFLSIECWGGSGLREMEAPSVEALRTLLRVSELLGYPVGPKHYANETPVRIEDIIVYAVRWEDPQTKCRYLDVLWRPELEVAGYTQGGHSEERTEGAFRGQVLACTPGGDWWPKKVINNRPVFAAITQTPTQPMLKAKEKFARDAVRNCSYCGKPATRQFMHVRMEDGLGGSMGGISFGCGDEVCAEKARAQKALRTSESSYQQEVWA